MSSHEPVAYFGDKRASGLLQVTRDPADLTQGWWAVVQTFEGEFFGFEFEQITHAYPIEAEHLTSANQLLDSQLWESSISQEQYEIGVDQVREAIADGWVYQTNFCRVLTQELSESFDSIAAYQKIRSGNPAPHACALSLPSDVTGLDIDIKVASASPELFLRRTGNTVMSSPIKGTATNSASMLEKDSAENVMIVDLIRNDLAQICKPGSVAVPDMLRTEVHPGLVHLVSDVTGELQDGMTWSQIFGAMCPPGSVSGAPKSSSLELISKIESVPREIYCGVIGWIDVDNDEAELAVGIRTFWQSLRSTSPTVCFGTGAGITYDSDPSGEWYETELKASHLLKVLATQLQ